MDGILASLELRRRDDNCSRDIPGRMEHLTFYARFVVLERTVCIAVTSSDIYRLGSSSNSSPNTFCLLLQLYTHSFVSTRPQ